MMGGLLGTVVQGFAFGTGSSIARNTVDSFMGGSGSSQEAPPQQQQQQAAQQELVKQAGQFASSPMMDPSKQQPNDQPEAGPQAGGEEEAAPGPSS
mgnify:CR=1 FL=1